MSNELHKSIREQLLADVQEGVVISKKLSNGVEVEMRQPSVGMRNRAIAESRMEGDSGSLNPMDFVLRIVCYCTYAPGTGQRVFSNRDFDKLNELTEAPWLDELCAAANELVSVSKEEVEKN